MLLAFLDESYTAERYYIAAFVIDGADEHLLHAARDRMRDFVAGFGVAADTDLHAHSLMTGRDGWEPVAAQVRARIRIYQQWCTELAALPGRLIVRGVDVQRLNARYKYPHPPHRVALQHTLESISTLAVGWGTRARVLADEVPGQFGHAADMRRYQERGTPGYQTSTLPGILPPLAFADSSTQPGLEAADAIAYLYRRYDAYTETSPKVRAVVERLWGSLEPLREQVWVWVP